MNPTLYDVLGVAPGARRDEIRAAWREAADRFEPGSGGSSAQFRLFNEAAEVLLDPERRSAYDATLEEEVAAPAPRMEPALAAAVPGPALPGTTHAVAPAVIPTGTPDMAVPDPTPDAAGETPEGSEEAPAAPVGDPRRRRLPRWVLVTLGVATALAVGVAAFAVSEARGAAAYQEAVDRAPSAAESAAAAILSYDHRSLEADRDAAARFLTDDYRGEYVDSFDKLVAESAAKTRTTVDAEVLASSVMPGGGAEDPERVPVLLFVNQTTRQADAGRPSVALNRVRFDMVSVDGTWLVDGITSY